MLKYLLVVSFFAFQSCSKENDLSAPAPSCLLSHVAIDEQVNDVTIYVDDKTGIEYAFVSFGELGPLDANTGFYIVDTSNPSNPMITKKVTNVGGIGIATWSHYAYALGGEQDEATILNLENISNPSIVGSMSDAFFATISESGLMVLTLPGAAIYDLTKDPIHPELLWSDDQSLGQEPLIVGNTLYGFYGNKGTQIYDITTPVNPKLITVITSLNIRWHGSGSVTANENYLIINDGREMGTKNDRDFTIWDISDKTVPKFIGGFNDPESSVSNVQVIGDKAHFAYYSSGYRIFNISNPTLPLEVFSYDTAPGLAGNGFYVGAESIAVAPSGCIFITDEQNGLFAFGNCVP